MLPMHLPPRWPPEIPMALGARLQARAEEFQKISGLPTPAKSTRQQFALVPANYAVALSAPSVPWPVQPAVAAAQPVAASAFLAS